MLDQTGYLSFFTAHKIVVIIEKCLQLSVMKFSKYEGCPNSLCPYLVIGTSQAVYYGGKDLWKSIIRPILQRIGMQSLVRYGVDVTLLSTVAT